jgi:transglutaminase-like putative cysteine protease
VGGGASRDSGRVLNVEVFDPASVSERQMRARVAAESLFVVADSAEFDRSLHRWAAVHSDTTRAWRIDALEHGLPVRRWVDVSGMPVRIEHPFGLTWQRSAFELVSTNYRSQPSRPLWDGTTSLIRLDRRPKAPAAKVPGRPLLLRVPGLDSMPIILERLLAEASNANLMGDTLRIPALLADQPAELDSATRVDWSGSTALIQTADPLVRETAERIVASEADTIGRLRRLASWVVGNIELEHRPGVASAVRTLSVKRGTLQDRITLLVALARALGIDAAPVSGLRWETDHFYLDGWMEALPPVRLAIDPLTGAVPAGGDRWPLLIGAMARTLDLAPPAGSLQVERIATEARP